VTIQPSETVRTAAARMTEHAVGTLVVMELDGPARPLGVVTDRDLVVRCLAARLDPDVTPVSEVMTTPVTALGEDTPIEDALSQMAVAGKRRVVVTSNGYRVAGILSLDDVLDQLFQEGKSIARLLEKQRPQISAAAGAR
jgi:CBS domain-containing protein